MQNRYKIVGRNDIRLLSEVDGEVVSHFRLKEFENEDGLVMVHASVLHALERVRRDLGQWAGEPVWVLITDSIRTPETLQKLAARLGWTDEGGAVSRHSKHLTQYGGIAVDLVAVCASDRRRVPQQILGKVCRQYFDWVKDDYRDGHVHADMRGVLEKA